MKKLLSVSLCLLALAASACTSKGLEMQVSVKDKTTGGVEKHNVAAGSNGITKSYGSANYEVTVTANAHEKNGEISNLSITSDGTRFQGNNGATLTASIPANNLRDTAIVADKVTDPKGGDTFAFYAQATNSKTTLNTPGVKLNFWKETDLILSWSTGADTSGFPDFGEVGTYNGRWIQEVNRFRDKKVVRVLNPYSVPIMVKHWLPDSAGQARNPVEVRIPPKGSTTRFNDRPVSGVWRVVRVTVENDPAEDSIQQSRLIDEARARSRTSDRVRVPKLLLPVRCVEK